VQGQWGIDNDDALGDEAILIVGNVALARPIFERSGNPHDTEP
jgi:hypothetical protein